MINTAYPVTSSFVYTHLFGDSGKKDPVEVQVSNSIASIINKTYLDGKADGQKRANRKEEYLKECKKLMKKSGFKRWSVNWEFSLGFLDLIEFVYSDGYRDGREEDSDHLFYSFDVCLCDYKRKQKIKQHIEP
jgi:hypothetical protein